MKHVQSVVALVALLGGCRAKPEAGDIIELDGAFDLNKVVLSHRRSVMLMHSGETAELKAFEPWLYAIVKMLPRLPFGRIDLSGPNENLARAFGVGKVTLGGGARRAPAIKGFFRDNGMGKRIIDYTGPLEFDALFSWFKSVQQNETEHRFSAPATEPPEMAAAGPKPKNAMAGLPDSVRLMAETMVREQRMQRVLKQQGRGMLEQYEQAVRERYNWFIKQDGFDADDKFAVQEANRKARETVRQELLESAPFEIREEIEEDVALGEAAQ